MQKTVVLIGVGLLVLATGHAVAGTSSADQVFAVKAAAGGEAEVVLGRLPEGGDFGPGSCPEGVCSEIISRCCSITSR